MAFPPSFAHLMAVGNTAFLNALGARAQIRSLTTLGFRNDMSNIVSAGFTNALSALANTVLGSGIPSVAPISIAFGNVGAPGAPIVPLPDGFPILPAFVPYTGFESPALFNVLLGQYNTQLINRAQSSSNLELTTDPFTTVQQTLGTGTVLGPGAAVFAP